MNGWVKRLGLIIATAFLSAGCSDQSESAAIPGEPAAMKLPDGGTALVGMFRYLADAPLFRDCSNGKIFPVAMAGPYLEVERAYLNSGIEPGKELKVAVHGRYLERPEMDGNSNEIMLVIDSFDGITDAGDCVSTEQAELEDTFWKLVELDGEAVAPPDGAQVVHLVLSAEGARVNGFAGCNNFFGQYQREGESLHFSALGSTMMACPEGMDTEQAFLKALGQTDRAELNGLFLLLYSSGHRVARLETVYLP